MTKECSFCGEPQEVVGELVAGPFVYICSACARLCVEIFSVKHIERVVANYMAAAPKHKKRKSPKSKVQEGK